MSNSESEDVECDDDDYEEDGEGEVKDLQAARASAKARQRSMADVWVGGSFVPNADEKVIVHHIGERGRITIGIRVPIWLHCSRFKVVEFIRSFEGAVLISPVPHSQDAISKQHSLLHGACEAAVRSARKWSACVAWQLRLSIAGSR